jgi:hypothetical protein
VPLSVSRLRFPVAGFLHALRHANGPSLTNSIENHQSLRVFKTRRIQSPTGDRRPETGSWQLHVAVCFIDWFRVLGFMLKPGVETKAARDVATRVANPPKKTP